MPPTDLDQITYWLEQIAAPDVVADYVIPGLGILATLVLGYAAVRAANAANRLAAQNVELAQRAERRRFGDAVLAYYESRREDILERRHWNMPHWTEDAEAVGAEVSQPNSDRLIAWVTDTIDHVMASDDEANRELNATHIRATVPVVIAKWVNDPAAFDEPPFRLWDERQAEGG